VELVVAVEAVVLADVVVAVDATVPFSLGVSPLAPGASPGLYLLALGACWGLVLKC
jgi:hypothetical protein